MSPTTSVEIKEEDLHGTIPLGNGLFMTFDLRPIIKQQKMEERREFMVTKTGRILMPSLNIF